MTNNLGLTFGQIVFNNGASSRTISGTISCVFDAQSQAIQNNSGNPQTIDFPFQIGVANSGVEVSFAKGAGLTFKQPVTLQSNTLIIEGDGSQGELLMLNTLITGVNGVLKLRNHAILEVGEGGSIQGTTLHVQGSKVQFSGNGHLGSTVSVLLEDGAELTTSDKDVVIHSITDNNNNSLLVSSGSFRITGNADSDLSTTTITSSATGQIIKEGTGTITLGQASGFTGVIQVASGTVVVTNQNVNISGINVSNTATFHSMVNTVVDDLTVAGTLQIETGRTFTANGVVNITGSVTGGGTFILGPNAQVVVNSLPLPGYISNPSNAEILVNPGQILDVVGTSTIAKLTMKSDDVNGQAALNISGSLTVTGTTTVEQTLNTSRNYYISSPTGSSPSGASAAFYNYNETSASALASDYWISANNYNSGIGFIAQPSSVPVTLTFNGALTNGDVSVNLTHSGSLKTGFNLIGNPYPSYINIQNLNFGSDVVKTIWYRTHNGSSYIFTTVNGASGVGTFGASSIVPPLQAFWVRCNAATSLLFTNALRTTGTDKLKAPAKQMPLVRLRVAAVGMVDETILYFNSNAFVGYDFYDSPKMSNENALVPELYTIAGNEQLAINGMPELKLNEIIPLGFRTNTAGGAFAIQATELNGIDSDVEIILKDGNVEYNLTNGDSYTFSSEKYDGIDRFSIVFRSKNSTSNTTDTKLNSAVAYQYTEGGIKVLADLSDNTRIDVFNAIGQLQASTILMSGSAMINHLLTAGVYWVKITDVGQSVTRKVIID